MKQKILIGAGTNSEKAELFRNLKRILNPDHEHFLTVLYLDEWLELVLNSNHSEHVRSTKSYIERVEFEVEMEELAPEYNMKVGFFKPDLTLTSLAGISSVADLMVIDGTLFHQPSERRLLNDFIQKLKCPVLILPEQIQVNRLIMLHDPQGNSAHMVKHFLKVFNPQYAQLALSVLFYFPDDEGQIENEKFFVDYMKMAFPNLGIQLMVDEPIEEFMASLKSDKGNAMVLVSEELGNDVLDCSNSAPKDFKNSPIFIFKN